MMPYFYVEKDGTYLSPSFAILLCLLVCFVNYVGWFLVCRSREDPSHRDGAEGPLLGYLPISGSALG